MLICFLSLFIFTQAGSSLQAAGDPHFPTNSVVLAVGTHVTHSDNGFGIINAEPYIDTSNKLLVPLRFISEELGARVDFIAPDVEQEPPIIIIKQNERVIILALYSDTALIDDQAVPMGTFPVIRNGSVLVPLRFLGEALGWQVHYKEEVIVIGSWFTEPTAEEARLWREALVTRAHRIFPEWDTQEIILTETPASEEDYVYYWRYQGNHMFALFKSLKGTQLAMVIVDDFYHNNEVYDYGVENKIFPYSFYVHGDSCYAVLHFGGATMGAEAIYSFSPYDGVTLLAKNRYDNNLKFMDGYIYFTSHQMLTSFNSTYRLNIQQTRENVKNNQRIISERLGLEDFFYGYHVIANEQMRSGGGAGFALDQGFFYANAYRHDEDPYTILDQGFYRVDLQTMEHEKLCDQIVIMPQVKDNKVYFFEEGMLWVMNLDGQNKEKLLDDVLSFFIEGDTLKYCLDLRDTEQTIWYHLPIK